MTKRTRRTHSPGFKAKVAAVLMLCCLTPVSKTMAAAVLMLCCLTPLV